MEQEAVCNLTVHALAYEEDYDELQGDVAAPPERVLRRELQFTQEYPYPEQHPVPVQLPPPNPP